MTSEAVFSIVRRIIRSISANGRVMEKVQAPGWAKLVLCASAVMMIALAGQAGAQSAATPSSVSAQTPEGEQATYMLGELRTLTPVGQPISTSLSLVRRTLKPAENRIVEVVATVESGKPVREFTTVFEVSGSKFGIRDDEGTFAGSGELVGKPWAWTGWNYEVEFTGARKGTLRGEDVLGSVGLSVKKSFSTPDGTVRVLFTEDLKPISKAAYEILRSKLVPETK